MWKTHLQSPTTDRTRASTSRQPPPENFRKRSSDESYKRQTYTPLDRSNYNWNYVFTEDPATHSKISSINQDQSHISQDGGQRGGKMSPEVKPTVLADLCSASIQETSQTLTTRAKTLHDISLDTIITMGVTRREFETWRALLAEASATELLNAATNEKDPFTKSMAQCLLQLCAYLEDVEFSLYGHNIESRWSPAHKAIDHYCRFDPELEDVWYSDDEDDDSVLDVSIRPLRPLAKALTDHGCPIFLCETSLEEKIADVSRSFASLDCFAAGLELRMYMSTFGHGLSSSVSLDAESDDEAENIKADALLSKLMKEGGLNDRNDSASRSTRFRA